MLNKVARIIEQEPHGISRRHKTRIYYKTGNQMQGIIDFHTHAFPDELAATAIPFLEEEGNVKAFLDGTVSDLVRSMDQAGIAKSILGSIATRPAHFAAILAWSKQVRSDRILPFPSFHPDDPDCLNQITQIRDAGFKGIKLHPYYQRFILDEAKMLPIYQTIAANGLILLMHTGFDIAYPRDPIASPARILAVIERFPTLKLVTSHLGAWEQWQEVNALLAGRPVYMDISYALDQINPDLAREIIEKHPPAYILFGSDSPWAGQQETITMLQSLGLKTELESRILRDNALALLGE